MYAEHWGIRKSPFSPQLSLEECFASATQEEALARLHYLVEAGQQLGLVSGGPGYGKTLLLAEFARQLASTDVQLITVAMANVGTHEFLWELAAALGTNPAVNTAEFALWRSVLDRFDQLAALQRRVVWLADDLQRADDAVLKLIERLVRRDQRVPRVLTLVCAVQAGSESMLGRSLAELIDLQVELEPWTAAEVSDYLLQAVQREGLDNSPFAEAAAKRIYQLSGGVPRRVNRMAELALLAGAGLKLDQLDGDVIEAVHEELQPGVSV